jgi:hypothetical protein
MAKGGLYRRLESEQADEEALRRTAGATGGGS